MATFPAESTCGACAWPGGTEREFYVHAIEVHHFDPGADGELAARMDFVLGGDWWRR